MQGKTFSHCVILAESLEIQNLMVELSFLTGFRWRRNSSSITF